jgi:hypothetical protein
VAPPPAKPAPPPVPDEPIVLPEDPPAALPDKRQPGKVKPASPPRASFPAEPPPSERAAPASEPVGPQPSPAPPAAQRELETYPELAAKPSDREKEDDTDGLFGPFRIGGLLGVGLPSVVSFGGAIKLTRYFGAGLNIGLIPTIKISLYGEAELSYQEYDIYGRIFPFGGMFFVGAGVGYATIAGSLRSSYDLSGQNLPPGFPEELFVESKASVRTLVLTPQIGVQHTFGSGFTVGVDVGAQIPLAPSEIEFETELPPEVPKTVIDQYVEPNNQKVRETLDTIGRAIVPTLNLRIGWLL